jgi:hypothetical protein
MIVPSGGVRVLVATQPVDFRKGMDGLAALKQTGLARRGEYLAAAFAILPIASLEKLD